MPWKTSNVNSELYQYKLHSVIALERSVFLSRKSLVILNIEHSERFTLHIDGGMRPLMLLMEVLCLYREEQYLMENL